MIESDIKAKLSFSDGTPDIDLPIYKGTVGPDVRPVSSLTIQAFFPLLLVIAKSRISRVIRVNCFIEAIQLKSWQIIATS